MRNKLVFVLRTTVSTRKEEEEKGHLRAYAVQSNATLITLMHDVFLFNVQYRKTGEIAQMSLGPLEHKDESKNKDEKNRKKKKKKGTNNRSGGM